MTMRDVLGKRRMTPSIDIARMIRSAIDYMYDENVGAVVVCDAKQVVGVFLQNDRLRRVVHQRLCLETTNVQDVLTSPMYWISTGERNEVAKAIMVAKGLRHLVVMDENRHFQSFVSSRELLEADLLDSRELVSKLNDSYYEHQFKPQSKQPVREP